MAEPLSVALVGIGKIATDQHVPSITNSTDWTLAATVSRNGSVEGVEAFRDMETMLATRPDIPVISLCLPPMPRFDYAVAAIQACRHVMLEKPPGATLSEVQELERLARNAGVTMYTTWHSRMAAGVAAAKAWSSRRIVTGGHIKWRESVRKWHPGQDWVFEPGGMGVFDPGINALSIMTEILPHPVHLRSAELAYPENRATPIAARLTFTGDLSAEFDWREEDGEIWEIEVETDGGRLSLKQGGDVAEVDGAPLAVDNAYPGEYPRLYARMADLVRQGVSEVDLAPMLHVADALTLGRRVTVEPFEF